MTKEEYDKLKKKTIVCSECVGRKVCAYAARRNQRHYCGWGVTKNDVKES